MVTAAARAVLTASMYMLDWPSCMPPFRIPKMAVITEPAVYLPRIQSTTFPYNRIPHLSQLRKHSKSTSPPAALKPQLRMHCPYSGLSL